MRNFNKVPVLFDKSKGSQKLQISRSFFERPKTRTMVSYDTGVPVKNIDRYIAELLKTGNLFIVKKDKCEITQTPGVIYYSSNDIFYPKNRPIQGILFKD